MSVSLSAFLAQNADKVGKVSVVASQRFHDESGKPIPWEIGCITAGENAKLRKSCMKQVAVGKGQYTTVFDSNAYLEKVAVRCTLFPDLQNTELQNSYGCMDAEQLIVTMLTPGEFEDYSTAVLKANGFKDEQELVDEAKNS